MEQEFKTNKDNLFSKYSLKNVDSKSKLLTRSLLWMSLGLMVIILVAWLSTVNDNFFNGVLKISTGHSWIISWVINLVLIVSLFMTVRNTKINIIVPIILFSMFSFYEGIFITSIVAFSGARDIVKDLFGYMLIPSAMFIIMGALGYFNVINFTKLVPFVIFSLLGILIFSLVLVFTQSKTIELVYVILSMVIFTIWIGVDLQMIMISDEQFSNSLSKKEMNRIAFMFGIRLFIDFVNLLSIIIRLLNITSR